MDRDLIKKYISKTCTDKEAGQVRDWLANPASDITMLHEVMDEMWQDQELHDELTSDDGKRLLAAINTKRNRRPEAILYRKRLNRFALITASVAASIVLFLYGFPLIMQKPGKIGVKMSYNLSPRWDTIKNETGITRRIEMPDRSIVILQAASSIAYNKEFNERNRQVRLIGEAYFEVSQDATRPFEVITDNLTTKVLGTSFNIEAYPFEPNIHVSLATGKVAIYLHDGTKDSRTEFLNPGQMLSYDRASGSNKIKPVMLQDYSYWLKGYLVFNDIPLKQVLDRISFRFRINIDYSALVGKMEDKQVTAVFRNENVYEILRSLLFLYGYRYENNKNGIILLPT